MNSLFDKISPYHNNPIITDSWKNDKIGEIVDVGENYVYRFVEHQVIDGKIHEIYTSCESIKTCPIVAVGLVAFCLKHHSTSKSTRVLFEGYYKYSLEQYEEEHRNDVDYANKDFAAIFLCYDHLRIEREYYKTSVSLFEFITEEDVTFLKELSTNYRKFVLGKVLDKKLADTTSALKPVERYLFFYRQYGCAERVASWIADKYDLNYSPSPVGYIENAQEKERHHMEQEDALDWIELFESDQPINVHASLIPSIYNHLANCRDDKERLNFATDLVLSFNGFAKNFIHEHEIKRNKAEIETAQSQLKLVKTESDKETILQHCSRIQEDIKRLEYREQRFYDIVQDSVRVNIGGYTMESILFTYWSSMIAFARKLSSILLRFGMDLKQLQEECGVYLIYRMNIFDYVDEKYVSNIEHAKKLLQAIHPRTSESDNTKDTLKEKMITQNNKNVFIVHGHDNAIISQTENFLRKIGYEPIVLRNKADGGKTIIEKIEEYTDVCYAIVLYTPCDVGYSNKEGETTKKPRARQNVVFEHGYLMGKLGRDHVCAIVQSQKIDLPSDLSGIVYIENNEMWEHRVAKEMKNVGLEIDMNLL